MPMLSHRPGVPYAVLGAGFSGILLSARVRSCVAATPEVTPQSVETVKVLSQLAGVQQTVAASAAAVANAAFSPDGSPSPLVLYDPWTDENRADLVSSSGQTQGTYWDSMRACAPSPPHSY